MWEAEIAERPSALMRREQRDLRSIWSIREAYEEHTRSRQGDILREQCWFISVNFSQDRRSLCVLSFLEAITPRLNKLRGSARKSLRSSIIYAAPRENIYAAARIDLHHSKGFMGLGQNRLPNRLNLGQALTKSGRMRLNG